MYKIIVVVLLLGFSPQVFSAELSCESLFATTYIQKISQGKRSPIYDSRILLRALEKIKNKDSATENIPFLKSLLSAANSEILRRLEAEYGNVPRTTLEELNVLKTAFDERVDNNSVTLDFYNSYLKIIPQLFSIFPSNLRYRIPNLLKERPDQQRGILLRTFADLDFYDFIELLPDYSIEGISLQNSITFDKITVGSEVFRDHDRAHAYIFHNAFDKLEVEQNEKLVQILRFLKTYRHNLSEEEQLIFGGVLFIPLHEEVQLGKIVRAFEPDSQRPFILEEDAKTAYNRIKDSRDLGGSIEMNMTQEEFVARFEVIFIKVRAAYLYPKNK